MANELRTRDGLPFNFVDGLRVRGTDIVAATATSDGLMSAADKAKLDNMETSGTANTAINLRPGANQGVVWDIDAFGGTQDTASITLETSAGEATKMRFKMTNDSDDNFEFTAKTADGLTVYNNAMTLNGNVILNAANYKNYSTSWSDVVNKPSQIVAAAGAVDPIVNWDSYVSAGIFSVSNANWGASPNSPSSSYNFGTLLVTSDNGTAISQIYMPHQGGLAYRSKWNADDWQAWRYVLDDGNFTNYAAAKTGGNASGTWGISVTGNAATVTDAGSSSAWYGYVKLPGSGIIIQWGRVEINDPGQDAFGTATFPIAFPNAVFQINTGLYSYATTAMDASSAVTAWTLADFSWTVQEWTSIVQDLELTYIAIGI